MKLQRFKRAAYAPHHGTRMHSQPMLGTAFRFVMLRFLPRRLVPFLALLEVIGIARRVLAARSRTQERRATGRGRGSRRR